MIIFRVADILIYYWFDDLYQLVRYDGRASDYGDVIRYSRFLPELSAWWVLMGTQKRATGDALIRLPKRPC